jgi:hypothetical protein
LSALLLPASQLTGLSVITALSGLSLSASQLTGLSVITTLSSLSLPSTQVTGLSIYAPLASLTFTGTVTLPDGVTITSTYSGYLKSPPSEYLTTSSSIQESQLTGLSVITTLSSL